MTENGISPMTKTLYRGFTITTPSGLDENDSAYHVYRIYKAQPLTTISSEEHFTDSDTALAAAKVRIDARKVTA